MAKENKEKIGQMASALTKSAVNPNTTGFVTQREKAIEDWFGGLIVPLNQIFKTDDDAKAKRLIQVATQMVMTVPAIAECSKSSIAGALIQAAIVGFEPIPQLGQCYFVPYNNKKTIDGREEWIKEIQFQIGYRGWVTLVRRSAMIKVIDAFEVLEGDEFKVTMGTSPGIAHTREKMIPPKLDGSNLTHVYAYAELINGGKVFRVLTKEEVEDYRKRSPSQKFKKDGQWQYVLSGAWKTDYPAMAKGKAIKQLCKLLPLEPEIQKHMATDEAVLQYDPEQGKSSFDMNDGMVDVSKIEYPDKDASSNPLFDYEITPEDLK